VENKQVIIFDGVCNFCNAAVNFIIKRDKKQKFIFTTRQSSFGKKIISKHLKSKWDNDTIVLIKNDNCFTHSEAVFEIIDDLSGHWRLLFIFKILPIKFRNYLYKQLAKHRYSIFGKREVCMIPNHELKSRFIS
jgi:predicted DCC family thiol-disulfide oxidoreductase YuxK